mgnify:FL=1
MKKSIFGQLLQIKERIRNAEYRFGRNPDSVQLIAVSKTQNLEAIRSAVTAGQRAFGENYAQEASEKILSLQNLGLEWHFVGRIQANKTKLIANNFSWIHSLADLRLAVKLNEYRKEANLAPINVCIQVNIQKEASKAGIYLEHLACLAKSIDKLSHLNLRGLMAIPKPEKNFASQRKNFKALRLSLVKLQALGLQLDTLSMGMSEDFEAAIAEGATLIRLGTAIFGKRKL